MTPFNPEYEVKSTGQVTALFKLHATTTNIVHLVEWLKVNKWRGALVLNYPGNGGVGEIRFAETPKALREEK